MLNSLSTQFALTAWVLILYTEINPSITYKLLISNWKVNYILIIMRYEDWYVNQKEWIGV